MRKMKDSGVKWMGEIPETWQVTKYKYFSQSRMGETILAADLVSEGIPVYSATNDNSIFGYVTNSKVVLHNGDLIIPARGNSIGYMKFVQDEIATCTQTTICSFNIHGINPKYLYYCSCGFKDDWYKYDGSAIPQVTVEQLKNNLLPLPSKEDQLLIADYLDKKCLQIDEIIMHQKEIINKLKEYLISITTEAVTKGLKSDVRTKQSNIKWIESYPVHWNEYRIANLYDQTSESGLEELPILTVSINNGISDRELADDEKDRVFVRSEDRTKYKRVRPGDLAYNMMRAWQGAFGAVRVDGMVSPAYVTCRLKPGVQIDSRYIEYLFRTPIAIEEMHRYSHGIADFRLRLYWPEFKNIRLCLPPIEEQREIADHIDDKTAKIEATIKRREDTIAKLQEYKKSLIYEVVTGKREVL